MGGVGRSVTLTIIVSSITGYIHVSVGVRVFRSLRFVSFVSLFFVLFVKKKRNSVLRLEPYCARGGLVFFLRGPAFLVFSAQTPFWFTSFLRDSVGVYYLHLLFYNYTPFDASCVFSSFFLVQLQVDLTSSAVFICFGYFLLGYGNLDPEFGGAHKGRIGIKAGLKDGAFFDCFFVIPPYFSQRIGLH